MKEHCAFCGEETDYMLPKLEVYICLDCLIKYEGERAQFVPTYPEPIYSRHPCVFDYVGDTGGMIPAGRHWVLEY